MALSQAKWLLAPWLAAAPSANQGPVKAAVLARRNLAAAAEVAFALARAQPTASGQRLGRRAVDVFPIGRARFFRVAAE
jgi:hypothetical protein